MRISDWSSDVCSSDLIVLGGRVDHVVGAQHQHDVGLRELAVDVVHLEDLVVGNFGFGQQDVHMARHAARHGVDGVFDGDAFFSEFFSQFFKRSEEHTSELQSLMRISYAVFCLKKKIKKQITLTTDIFYLQ